MQDLLVTISPAPRRQIGRLGFVGARDATVGADRHEHSSALYAATATVLLLT